MRIIQCLLTMVAIAESFYAPKRNLRLSRFFNSDTLLYKNMNEFALACKMMPSYFNEILDSTQVALFIICLLSCRQFAALIIRKIL